MMKIVPILPCSDTTAQIAFYRHLGFELAGQHPRSYLVFLYQDLELHFYGSKKLLPQDNPSMCLLHTDDVEQLYRVFTTGLTAGTGKVPRSGFPKVTKIRELSEDWRFTITDPSGNTIYITQPKPMGSGTYFRDIANVEYAKKFASLYDLIYSKEDMALAGKLLPQLLAAKESFGDLDKAKLCLLALAFYHSSGLPHDNTELESLLAQHGESGEWQRIKDRLSAITP